jgi:hypothetical protein
VPLALALGGVLAASSPAWATVKASWNTPTDNSTFTTTNPIDFSVTLDRGAVLADSSAVSLTLAVPGPQPGPFKVDTSSSSSDKDLKFTFTPACPNYAGTCASGSAPAYNGRYTAAITGAATGSRTVVVQIPPAAPTGVTATAAGTHTARISWDANHEPDLTGYDVFTGDGSTIAANLPTDQTYFQYDLGSSGYGGTHTYVVRAHRLACANCSGPGSDAQLDSQLSAPASVTFDEPGATTSNTGGGDTTDGSGSGYNNGNSTGGNGTGGTSNNGNGSGSTSTDQNGDAYNSGNTSGGSFSSGSKQTTTQQRTAAFGLTFKSFAPKLGAPKLPPQPKFASPTVGALPEGTYDPMLNYGHRTVTTRDKVASGSNSLTQAFDSLTTAFEGRKLYRSIAIALLLLLAAAHLRLWLRHPDAV